MICLITLGFFLRLPGLYWVGFIFIVIYSAWYQLWEHESMAEIETWIIDYFLKNTAVHDIEQCWAVNWCFHLNSRWQIHHFIFFFYTRKERSLVSLLFQCSWMLLHEFKSWFITMIENYYVLIIHYGFPSFETVE